MTHVVAVVGPPLSGAGSVAAALRNRLDGATVIEANAVGPGLFPDVVVFVASAAAPMSDCEMELLAVTAERTDAVVGALAKIDVHRAWSSVLDVNRAVSPDPAMPWVAVAAAPEIGPCVIEPLVDAVRSRLDDEHRPRRNLLRARAWELKTLIAERERAIARRDGQLAEAARRTALHAKVRQFRVQLAAEARERSAALRAELHREAAAVSRRGIRSFDARALHRAQRTADGFDRVVAQRMTEIAGTAPIASASPVSSYLQPPWTPVLEDRLSAALGIGFGLGVALTLGRFAAAALPAAAMPAVVPLCGVAGLALAVWLVRTRRLMTARASRDRWAAEVAVAVRSALEGRVLAAESALLAAPSDVPPASGPGGDPAVERWAGELARVRTELGDPGGWNPVHRRRSLRDNPD